MGVFKKLFKKGDHVLFKFKKEDTGKPEKETIKDNLVEGFYENDQRI